MKNLPYKSIYSILFIVILLTFSCNKDDDMDEVTNTCPDCPVVDRIEPSYGQSGDMVTIHGSKFNALTDIYFNDRKATLIEDNNTDKLIEAVVPSLSGSNKSLIIAEKTFNAPNGNIQTLRSTDEIFFTYITNNASLSSLSPASGPAGVEVTVIGSDLNNVERVTFGDNDAEIVNKSASEISVRAPSTTSLDVVDVIAYSEFTVDGEVTEIPSNSLEFSYLEGHNITDFSPKAAKMGEEITVTGSNFGTDTSDIEILTNGVPSDVISVQDNQIIFEVPKSAGSGIISVLREGISVESGEEFEYIFSYIVTDFHDLGYNISGIDHYDGKVISHENETSKPKITIFREGVIDYDGASNISGSGAFDKNGKYYGTGKEGLASMEYNNNFFSDIWQDCERALDMAWIDNDLYLNYQVAGPSGNHYPIVKWKKGDTEYSGDPILTIDGPSGDGAIPRSGNAFFFLSEINGSDKSLIFTDRYRLRNYNPSEKTIETLTGLDNRRGYSDGTLDKAKFNILQGIASNEAGVYYVCDLGNHCIRKIDTKNNLVTTVAGTNEIGDRNGEGEDARFIYPRDICFDQDGNLLVADNVKIRKITIE